MYLTLIYLLLALTPIYAQSSGQSITKFNFQNEKLSSVLTQLSKEQDFNFSYDANDPVYNEYITYSSDESAEKVLDHILASKGLKNKRIGNQLVIYHPAEDIEIDQDIIKNIDENTTLNTISPSTEIVSSFEIDTIYLQDTILRIDTVRITDTVFIEKQKPEKPSSSKIKDLPVDFFQKETNRDKGWAGGVFIAPVLSDFSLVKNNVTFSLRNFSLGMEAVKLVNRWNFYIGLRYSHYSQQFTQQYSVVTGGNYQTDTIEIYYTIVETDTSWYYVTDSSWIPLDSKEYNYERSNAIGCFELNIAVSYDFYKSANLRVYGKMGGQIGWLLYKNGMAIPDEVHTDGVDFRDLQFNSTFALSAGLGLKSRMTDRLDFNTELYYIRYFNQLVKEYEYDNKLNAIGLKFGLIYYF
jgi:hypothetical protein